MAVGSCGSIEHYCATDGTCRRCPTGGLFNLDGYGECEWIGCQLPGGQWAVGYDQKESCGMGGEACFVVAAGESCHAGRAVAGEVSLRTGLLPQTAAATTKPTRPASAAPARQTTSAAAPECSAIAIAPAAPAESASAERSAGSPRGSPSAQSIRAPLAVAVTNCFSASMPAR